MLWACKSVLIVLLTIGTDRIHVSLVNKAYYGGIVIYFLSVIALQSPRSCKKRVIFFFKHILLVVNLCNIGVSLCRYKGIPVYYMYSESQEVLMIFGTSKGKLKKCFKKTNVRQIYPIYQTSHKRVLCPWNTCQVCKCLCLRKHTLYWLHSGTFMVLWALLGLRH